MFGTSVLRRISESKPEEKQDTGQKLVGAFSNYVKKSNIIIIIDSRWIGGAGQGALYVDTARDTKRTPNYSRKT